MLMKQRTDSFYLFPEAVTVSCEDFTFIDIYSGLLYLQFIDTWQNMNSLSRYHTSSVLIKQTLTRGIEKVIYLVIWMA